MLVACLVASSIQADANAVVGAVASLLGGLIGAGGAAGAVYLTLRGQQEDEKSQTRTSLYLEVAEYLWQTVDPHANLAALCKSRLSASPVDNNTKVMLRGALNMPPSVYLPANNHKLARLDNPQTVRHFYAKLEIMRAQKGLPGMEGVETAPTRDQLSYLLKHLGIMMMVGISLLETPDLAEIQPAARKQLVESLKRSLATSPVISPRYSSDHGLSPQQPTGVGRT